jgi:hypothetical protein
MILVCPTIVELRCVDTGGSVDSDRNGIDSGFRHKSYNDKHVRRMQLYDIEQYPGVPVDDWVTGDH